MYKEIITRLLNLDPAVRRRYMANATMLPDIGQSRLNLSGLVR